MLADRSRPIPDGAKLPVILLHGLFTCRGILWPLGRHLKRDGRPPIYYGYPSRLLDIPANAQRLAGWMQRLGAGPFDVVTHSQGGIILRWAAANHSLPRLRRVVMIAPPNRGSQMAHLLHQRLGMLFRLIYGSTGLQLRRGSLGLAESAGLPEGEIGIIAGGMGNPKGFNRFLPGDNDMTVAVEETILRGMKDFVLLRHRHTPLLWFRETADYTLRFLATGRFRIPALDPKDTLPLDKP